MANLSANHPQITGWGTYTDVNPSLIKGGKNGVSVACANWLKFSLPDISGDGLVAARLLAWVSGTPVAYGDGTNVINIAAQVSDSASWDAGSSLATLKAISLWAPTYPILGVDANTAAEGDFSFWDVTAGINRIYRANAMGACGATVFLGFFSFDQDNTLDTRDYPRIAFPSDFNASSTNKMDEVKFAGLTAGAFKPGLRLFHGNDITPRPGAFGGGCGWVY